MGYLAQIYLVNIVSLETWWPSLQVAQNIGAKYTHSTSVFSLLLCCKETALYWVSYWHGVNLVIFLLNLWDKDLVKKYQRLVQASVLSRTVDIENHSCLNWFVLCLVNSGVKQLHAFVKKVLSEHGCVCLFIASFLVK